MNEHEWLAERFEADRTRLRAVAFRMLGSLSEADDAVQESWLRVSRSHTGAVENLDGWLTTVVARVCLNMLRSRKSRREEPLSGHESIVSRERWTDPEHEALLADSVGLAMLVVPSLRDASLHAVDSRLTGVLQRRARHVVTENARVARTAALLRGGALQAIGALLDESHASLRDDFEVSCAELDLATQTARSAGAWGARMTGAGFGGCAIALVPSGQGLAVTGAVRAAFAAHGYRAPTVFPVTAAGGARRCE